MLSQILKKKGLKTSAKNEAILSGGGSSFHQWEATTLQQQDPALQSCLDLRGGYVSCPESEDLSGMHECINILQEPFWCLKDKIFEVSEVTSVGGAHERTSGGYEPDRKQYSECREEIAYEGRRASTEFK